MYRVSVHTPSEHSLGLWRAHAEQGDAPLLAGYDPAVSLAWLGAMPDPTQLGLFEAPMSSEDAASDRAFHKAGFTVRVLAGKGSRTRLAAFTRAHHYLRGAGMAGGIAFGLFAPDGAMVGVAVFARPTQPRTAAGMFPRPLDTATLGAWSHHAEVAESEVLDFVRLTVLDTADAHCNLGTGAESFFVRQAVAQLEQRNRERFRAIRRAELGLAPLSAAMAAQPWIKCVRTFSDPAVGHNGGIYRACDWLPIGQTRVERQWVGLRSGLPLSGRQRSKLLNPEDSGHLSNGLRAAWEGADCLLEGRDVTGAVVATRDLASVRDLPTFDVVTAKRRLREILRGTPSDLHWSVRYLAGGFRIEERPPKARFALFLGTAPVARAIARRCRYLQPALLAADAAWFAPARRWGRGVGFNWPRRPTDTDLLRWARREIS